MFQILAKERPVLQQVSLGNILQKSLDNLVLELVEKNLVAEFMRLYRETTDKRTPIHKLTVELGNLVDADTVHLQLDLFADTRADERESKLQHALLDIKGKFGKNAVLRGINYHEKSTGRKRNTLVGGHNG